MLVSLTTASGVSHPMSDSLQTQLGYSPMSPLRVVPDLL